LVISIDARIAPYPVQSNEEEFLWRGADTNTVLNGTAAPSSLEV
jgi:hypothetical protein